MSLPTSPGEPTPIILHAVEGLCARLSAILSFRLEAIRQRRPLLVVWIPDDACTGHFLDHFEPLEDVTFITNEEAQALPSAHHVPRTIDFDEHIRHHAGGEASCFAPLIPQPEVAAAVAANLRELGPDAIAIHVRRTDHFALSCDRVRPTTDVEFERCLDAPPHVHRRIFLATDNATSQRRFLARYGERIRACTPLEASSATEPSALRHTTLREAVIDLLTCAG